MQASFAQPAAPPRDYFVPNFGVDKDVIATQKHIKQIEKREGHEFNPETLKPFVPEMPPPIPDLGVDADILTTHKNLKDSEKDLGHSWDLV